MAYTNGSSKSAATLEREAEPTERDLRVPDEPFPHVNTTDEFRSRVGLDR